MTECVVCGKNLHAEEEWRLRPDIEPGKLESEQDEDYVKPYLHEGCSKYFSLLEKLADKEHRQWISLTKYYAEDDELDISVEKLEHWKSLWKPYRELSDEMKEKDRKWARKALKEIPSVDLRNQDGEPADG